MSTIEIIRIIEEIIITLIFCIIGVYYALETLKMNKKVKQAIIEEKRNRKNV